MARIHEHTVNIAAPLTLVSAIPLAMQGDAEADELILHVVNGRESADMSGYTVGGYLERADGIRVMLKGSVTADVVQVKLQEACYRVPGAYKAFVRLTKTTGEKMTLFLFAGRIEGEGDGEIVDEEDTLPSVEELIAMIEEIDRAIAEANEARDDANAAATGADAAAAEAIKAAENAGKAEKAANDAAYEANAAADAADEAAVGASAWAKATMEAESLPEGSEPTISVEKNVNGGNVIRVGIPAGKTGKAGETGATPQITFEVETGAAGTDVKVEQSGTAEEPHIKLTIPRGDTGAVEGVDYYEGDPAPLGTASPGTSNGLARGNHVHPMPTAAEVGALPSNGTAVNANALNGKSADQYMLKTGTAADSYKLDGKDSVYYHKKFSHPRNLLDNSDFRNPVNQRDVTNGNYSWEYTIDRWMVAPYAEGTVYVDVVGVDGAIGFSCGSEPYYVFQRLPKTALKADTAYTLAYKVHNGGIVTAPYPLDDRGDYYQVTLGFEDVVYLEWAALCEGEYTAENLPPYVPKGYAAELAECLRYYVKLGRLDFVAMNQWTLYAGGVRFPLPMRINNPTVTFSNPGTGTVNVIGKWTGSTFEDFGRNEVTASSLTNAGFTLANSAGTFEENTFYTADINVSADL